MDPSLLPSLAWFATVAKHRSFTKAADEMGVTRAALSQNLKALEQKLQSRLLHRTTRHMSLTGEGQRLLDELQPALESINKAVINLNEANAEPAGLLRINTSRIAAKTLVEPNLAEFMVRYPKIQIELIMDDGMSNIVAEGCDAGIRLGDRLAGHTVAVPITPKLGMAVVASPAYWKKHGKPETPQDLAKHNCVSYRHTSSGAIFEWEFAAPKNHKPFTLRTHGRYTTNDDEGMIRAALDGMGVIQHIRLAVQPHLKSGKLVEVLKPWCHMFDGFYLYVPSREQMSPKVKALRDYLIEKRKLVQA